MSNAIDTGVNLATIPSTFAAWIYPTAGASASKVLYIAGVDGSFTQIDVTGTTLTVERFNNSNAKHLLYTQAVPLSDWTHVATRSNNTTTIVYVNGVSVFTDSTYDATGTASARILLQQDWVGAIRYVYTSLANLFAVAEVQSVMQDPQRGLMLAFFAPNTWFIPLLPGGSRLAVFGTNVPTLTISGTVPELQAPSPPYNWATGIEDPEQLVPTGGGVTPAQLNAMQADSERRALAATGGRGRRR